MSSYKIFKLSTESVPSIKEFLMEKKEYELESKSEKNSPRKLKFIIKEANKEKVDGKEIIKIEANYENILILPTAEGMNPIKILSAEDIIIIDSYLILGSKYTELKTAISTLENLLLSKGIIKSPESIKPIEFNLDEKKVNTEFNPQQFRFVSVRDVTGHPQIKTARFTGKEIDKSDELRNLTLLNGIITSVQMQININGNEVKLNLYQNGQFSIFKENMANIVEVFNYAKNLII